MNEQVFKETIANEFPDEDMLDKTFRDKVMHDDDYVGDNCCDPGVRQGDGIGAGDAVDYTRDYTRDEHSNDMTKE